MVKFNTKTWEIIYTKYYGVEIIKQIGEALGEFDESHRSFPESSSIYDRSSKFK